MSSNETPVNGGDLPFARTLFDACDQLRGSVESAEYKQLVLGLVFLKYVSDAFGRRRLLLGAELSDPQSPNHVADEAEREEILEDRDEYLAAIRVKIKRLLRRHGFTTSSGAGLGGGVGVIMSTDEVVSLILNQARALYAAWPEV